MWAGIIYITNILKVKYMRLAFLFFISFPIFSEPWIDLNNHNEVILLNKKIKDCDGSYIVPSNAYPISYGHVNYILNINAKHSKT